MGAGASVPGAQINLAGRQRMLSQKMSKEAVMVLLGIDTSTSQAALNSTVTEYGENWADLLNGNSDRSLPEITDECAVAAMDQCQETLMSMRGKLMPIVESASAESDDVETIAALSPELLSHSNRVVQILKGAVTCDESTTTLRGKTANSAGTVTVPGIMMLLLWAAFEFEFVSTQF